MAQQARAKPVRLAEVVAILSLATDLGNGFPMEHALRSCLLVRGLSNQEMGKALSISKVTVGHHIQHIYDKIGVFTRAAARG